jgi:hypothetical protein
MELCSKLTRCADHEQEKESEGSKAGNADASCKIGSKLGFGPIEGERRDLTPVGAPFVDHCISKGRIVTRRTGKRTAYFVTEDGQKELERLDITL